MAALPYMQFYPSDYLADTPHLNAEEHGAYLLLILNYWQTGKPIPVERLQGVARMFNDRWATVQQVLSAFFVEEDGVWRHRRIDADLDRVRAEQEQRIKAGKASAEARKRKKLEDAKRLANDRSATVQRKSNGRSTNIDTDTDTDTKTLLSPAKLDDACPHQKIVQAWHEVRPELPRVRAWDGERPKHLRARWRADDAHQTLEFWENLFRYIGTCPHLMGDNDRGWTATLPWLIKPENFAKVIEGNYDKRPGNAA